MHVLAFEGAEERPIERVTDPAANEPGVDVHAGLDGRVIRGPWSIPSAARETDDPTGANRNDDAIPTAGMFREPLAALFNPRGLGVERRVRGSDVVVVDLADRSEIAIDGGAN